ncbi:LytS/YhcK type 5TM receptor domain-containing protein [Methanobrevibacter thaueri]|uniref:Sensor histidine kinase YpdA n=1 Tax=Methanobrevibacter thaueri TaxID=190975 RepID=A0A315XL62_9EURY|nr:LytS/YhcK type 5TM receptor domain-containing protein [Methanobrevibacter thaueri]PWB85491.1 sensor histidine kinase YpdA [Methanobrevibacter thaueri]
MYEKIKNNAADNKKILILFIILFIFNIAFYFNLFAYMVIIKEFDIAILHDLITIISAIIILGFISTRLPKLKEITDGSVYEIAYLIIMGLLSITISYFNKSTNGESLWAPFLEMFRMLSVVLILTYLATKSKSFRSIVKGEFTRKTILWQILICSVLGILASYFTMNVNGAPANARGLVVMIASLLGGPYLGIPVAIISGVWRYFLGGPTALACGVSTVLAGVIGSLVFIWNRGKFLRAYKVAILMFLFSGFDMFIVTVLTPKPDGILVANAVYAPMTFAAVLGMLLFTMFLGEKKEEAEINDELKQTIDDNTMKISDNTDIIDLNTDRIIEISQELKEYKEKVDRLEQEMKEMRNE